MVVGGVGGLLIQTWKGWTSEKTEDKSTELRSEEPEREKVRDSHRIEMQRQWQARRK